MGKIKTSGDKKKPNQPNKQSTQFCCLQWVSETLIIRTLKMYSCINELFEWLVTECFVARGRLAVLYSDRTLAPVYTVRRSRLVCDEATFHTLSFPRAPARPGLRWDWKRNFWNTRGRPFLWYCHPSQNQELSENLPKEEKNPDCQGEFASLFSKPRGFGKASECLRGYSNQSCRLALAIWCMSAALAAPSLRTFLSLGAYQEP